ncbi:EF-P lysine aminoacylase GenX [Siccirubricoccus sp. KC 17139]|uniref:EF-P lysine aminoacylase GenX n=1 Tax=Siccirubricoccus soli TaxID=2899147 RepID=A0ABT1D8H7_9PROT|nr:EF-P lysine aminoacylase EpmA [Siccirubricoccus soli]MCO6418242.1 EF-P lysine aminoacylase GenX [Siccirubricoccus soli]MCP2684377.1 EF-P lysine aminoacylase EpmA [Siccirubricoccus soli]
MPASPPISSPPWHPERLAARLPFLRRRAELTAATRAFFTGRGFTEVETPCLVPVPGMEVHLHAFRSEYVPHLGQGERRTLWLRTSPELALKRLLVAGAGPVFELARVWRNGEASPRHAPEFTMLEWYAPGLGLAGLMDQVEAYLRAVAPPRVSHEGVACDLTLPFERLTMAEAFARWCHGLDILATEGDAAKLRAAAAAIGVPPREDEGWEDLFFRLVLERIEPNLGRGRATFLTHWPAPQAALARRDPADPRAALRFELFVAGIELANAFDELTDPVEQRARFVADVAERRARYGTEGWEVDEDFLAALEHGMPEGSGIALGFDRLAMLASGAPRITDVLWLPALP